VNWHRSADSQVQPFGQVPILQDGAFTLFESGAIALATFMKKGSMELSAAMSHCFARALASGSLGRRVSLPSPM
jgi:hypothetical protein